MSTPLPGVEHQWKRLNNYMVFCTDCAKQRWQDKDVSLATAVKALREAAGFTQESLAERLRISAERIKELEHQGYASRQWIRLETLESLAYACGATLIVRFEVKEP